jgi:hypothetical protein
VHCVIVGFGVGTPSRQRRLFEYETVDGAPHEVKAASINPYLVDAAETILPSRRQPISNVPPIVFGSMPNDGGNLLLTDDEKRELLRVEPQAAKWIRPFIGADEFINRIPRWCLWLVDCPAAELKTMPAVAERVAAVRQLRAASSRETTRALAATPTLFGEIRQPQNAFCSFQAFPPSAGISCPLASWMRQLSRAILSLSYPMPRLITSACSPRRCTTPGFVMSRDV